MDWKNFNPKATFMSSLKSDGMNIGRSCCGGSCIGGNCKAGPMNALAMFD